MTEKIEIVARNMRLTDNVREYVEKKANKLERHLQELDEIRVELGGSSQAGLPGRGGVSGGAKKDLSAVVDLSSDHALGDM